MSHIFISYAHEDRSFVVQLADALAARGSSVWWDRNIPAGKVYSHVIADALANARCVIVVWSASSVNSNWVCEEADDGRLRKILIPVVIDHVTPPMGFRSIQAADMSDWDGNESAPSFQQLTIDIAALIDPAYAAQAGSKEKRQWRWARRAATGWSAGVMALAIVVVLVALGMSRFREPSPPGSAASVTRVSAEQRVSAELYFHERGFTLEDANRMKKFLDGFGISSRVSKHRDPKSPDSIFIGAFVGARDARVILSAVPYEIKYLFRPDYPESDGGSAAGLLVGVGYLSTHREDARGQVSEPLKISLEDVRRLIEPGLTNAEFQRRLRQLTRF